jgi:putative peptidoglycan lipid II flippase
MAVDALERDETARLVSTGALVGALVLAGNLLGFVRDLLLAALFGASAKTDAFLVAWTIPETTTTLLLEGAMVYVFVPLLTSELKARGHAGELVRRSLLPLTAVLAALAIVTAAAAPLVAKLAAPGLASGTLAVTSLRWASATILFIGVAGYLCAVLRAHDKFVVPALVYVAYNVGIVATIVVLHRHVGVVSAAIGLAIGSALMVVLQLPAFVRTVRVQSMSWRLDRRLMADLSAFVPIGLFFAFRQSQVYVERFLGSFLAPGSISHLNYSMKTAQVPATVVLGLAIVSFPMFARLAVAGDHDGMRTWLDRTMRLVIALVLPAIAALAVFAPAIIGTLYGHGAFNAHDVAATASVMRIYCLGLIGQVAVSVAVLAFFAARTKLWVPVRAAVAGLVVDAVVGMVLLDSWGARGLALGNVVGILTMGALLVAGIDRHVVDIRITTIVNGVFRLSFIAVLSALGALAALRVFGFGTSSAAAAVLGPALTALCYLAVAYATRADEIEPLFTVLDRRRVEA